MKCEVMQKDGTVGPLLGNDGRNLDYKIRTSYRRTMKEKVSMKASIQGHSTL